MWVPVRAVLASRSVGHRKNTGCDNSHCGLRNGGCELLFGDGTVEDTWMVDQVSLMACGGLSASRKR